MPSSGFIRDLFQLVSERFARALYRLALLFDPQILVVSGDWTETGELGEELLARSYEQLWQETGYGGKLDTPQVRFSSLGQDAVTLGACAAIMDRVSTEVIEE
jgi:predicted NBD/HSP70 family sugar kinase